MKTKQDIRIEFPSVGTTYANNVYAVYEYGTYSRSSVNYGMLCRSFLDSFDTLEEARKAFPGAREIINEPLPVE
jgi:hypothetical protein